MIYVVTGRQYYWEIAGARVKIFLIHIKTHPHVQHYFITIIIHLWSVSLCVYVKHLLLLLPRVKYKVIQLLLLLLVLLLWSAPLSTVGFQLSGVWC